MNGPVLVGMHECVTCPRCATTYAVVHPACPKCSERDRAEPMARLLVDTFAWMEKRHPPHKALKIRQTPDERPEWCSVCRLLARFAEIERGAAQ